MRPRVLLFLMALLYGPHVHAQLSLRNDTVALPFIQVHYLYQQPEADMGNRFDANSAIGGGVYYKNRYNWSYGLTASFLFGGSVREENLFGSIATHDGRLVTSGGRLTTVETDMRGLRVMGSLGKIFPWIGPNPNSGVSLQLGAGLLQHRINFANNQSDVPQIQGDYQKGYDRLTNGFALVPQLTYLRFDNENFINVRAGLDLTLAWTQSRRDWNYAENRAIDEARFDVLIGFKGAWVFPIFDKQSRVQRKKSPF